MKKPIVFMYSGQGSQYFHMARELYEQNPRFQLWMDNCDELATPILGKPLLGTLFDAGVKKSDPFDSLADSNAALLCVEYSLTRLVQELGLQPDLLLGYSLGEITAAVVAEVFSLDVALTIAVEAGRLFEQHTPRASMLAIFGPVELLSTHAGMFERCWVTGRNFANSFVVSGRVADIDTLQRLLERENIVCQRLPVNYGMHTPLIDPIEQQCLRLLAEFSFSPPRIPIVSAVATRRVEAVSAETIWFAMRRPVEFSQTIERLLAEGDTVFLDLGPSGTLATFVKYILPSASLSRQASTLNRFGNDVEAMQSFKSKTAGL